MTASPLPRRRAKLDPVRVQSIREAYATGRWTQQALAEIQGVSRATIGSVLRGEFWKNQPVLASPEKSCSEVFWRVSCSSLSSAGSLPTARNLSPNSPYLLIHEHPLVSMHPWRVLVSCLFCNGARGYRALPLLADFFRRWPRVEDVIEADEGALVALLRPLGFANVRVKRITEMCREILRLNLHLFPYRVRDVKGIPGVGPYAQDVWALFVLGRTDVEPRHRDLQKWLSWRRSLIG